MQACQHLSIPFMKSSQDSKPQFGKLLLACAFAVVVCGLMVWLNSTYFPDCCGP
jgi:hypothetical protein